MCSDYSGKIKEIKRVGKKPLELTKSNKYLIMKFNLIKLVVFFFSFFHTQRSMWTYLR